MVVKLPLFDKREVMELLVLLEAYFIPLNVLMVTMEVNQLRRIE